MKKPTHRGHSAKHHTTTKHHHTAKHHAPKKHHPKIVPIPVTVPVHHHAKQHHQTPRHISWNINCVLEALAASLMSIGAVVEDEHILNLYSRLNSIEGVTIQNALKALRDYGLAGVFPKSFAKAEVFKPGLILGFTLTNAQKHQDIWDTCFSPEWGTHAVLLTETGVHSWGTDIPVTMNFLNTAEEAWEIMW